MEVDTIITLDNELEYALLERLEYNNKVYFFAAGIDKEENSTGEYIFIEEIKQDGKLKVQLVTDEELLTRLSTIVTKEYYTAAEEIESQEQ